jgi:uncharacterized membrane protein YhhN
VSPVLVSLLGIPALGALLWARKREHARALAVAKPLCSLLFVAAALLWTAREPVYGSWILAALVLSFAGDMALLGEGRRWVGAGLVGFLLAHLCYLVAVVPHSHVAEAPPLALAATAALLLAVGGGALRFAWPKLGRLAPAATLYFLVLASLTWLAVAGWCARPRDTGATLLGAGLLLFFVSDLAVARHRFVEKSFRNKLWGLPTYYLAQHLLAASRAYVG